MSKIKNNVFFRMFHCHSTMSFSSAFPSEKGPFHGSLIIRFSFMHYINNHVIFRKTFGFVLYINNIICASKYK